MQKTELAKRYLFFLAGLFISAFGVSFITKADLGTSPISSIPYTLSLAFSPSLGAFTLYFSLLLIAAQLFLMRRNFPKQYWMQIPISFLFSWFIDLSMNLLSALNPQLYLFKIFLLLIGCAILGFGVFTEIVANVAMLPGESLVSAVVYRFHTDFGKTKIAFDTIMSISAAILGLILFHHLAGVREGTLISAILVGMIARTLKKKIGFIERYLIEEKTPSLKSGN